MVEEAHSDVAITSDTGCVTTLDKSQWIGKAHGLAYMLPVLSDVQFVALALGAHPYKIAQLHWHSASAEALMTKMGIDWTTAKAEFREYLQALKNGQAPELLHPAHGEVEKFFAINKGQVLPDDGPNAPAPAGASVTGAGGRPR
jgi:heterodisulfide reductase subunit B